VIFPATALEPVIATGIVYGWGMAQPLAASVKLAPPSCWA
jgi:hypothetical protein